MAQPGYLEWQGLRDVLRAMKDYKHWLGKQQTRLRKQHKAKDADRYYFNIIRISDQIERVEMELYAQERKVKSIR